MVHIPVLQTEVIQYLDPKANDNFIDCTIGGGGHALAILERSGPKGKVLGIDADPETIKNCKLKIGDLKKRVILVCDNFSNLKEIVKQTKFKSVQGILLDLGMSSWHLEESGRGFTFRKNEPLDMRYNPQGPLTAEKIVNYWSESEIEIILRDFGEERFSQNIARGIVRERKLRPIKTTLQLVNIIQKSVPEKYQYPSIHFATRTFQGLRIAVNGELENLEKILPQSVEVLRKNGRLVIISFHSLEDRMVKNFFKENKDSLTILTKKPVCPTEKEIKINPRSRSSKLRAAQKI